jgi:hypothetical protein
MAAWGRWIESVKDSSVEHGGFGRAREISHGGAKNLPWGKDSITGYSIIKAGSLEDAEKIARENPFIASIRIYELREG